MNKNHTILALSVVALFIAVYFGLTTQIFLDTMGSHRATNWGRVLLSAIFGFGGVGGVFLYFHKKNTD